MWRRFSRPICKAVRKNWLMLFKSWKKWPLPQWTLCWINNPEKMHYEKDQKGAAWLYQMFLPLHQVYFNNLSHVREKEKAFRKLEKSRIAKNIVDIMTSCLVSLFVKCCYSKKNKGLTDKNLIFALVSQVPQATRRRGGDIPSTRARPTCSLCKQPMKVHKNVTDCPKKGAFPDEGTHILGNVF